MSTKVIETDMMVWPGQAEFLQAEGKVVAMFTGAGYGKSATLIRRAIFDHAKQDGWHLNCNNWKDDHLKMMFCAPQDRYLTARLCPAFRGQLSEMEAQLGRAIRKRTGRLRDGWFGSKAERKQEMANGVDFLFFPLYSSESAVATDAAGLYVDEVTMLKEAQIWNRATQRVRDPRAKSLNIAITGTPEKDHFIYNLMIDYETEEPYPGNIVVMDSSIRNPVLPLSWFESVGQQSTRAFKEMQVMGKWVKGGSGQRFSHIFDEKKHVKRTTISPANKGLRFDVGWDPGYRTGHVVFMYRHPRGFWVIVDEIVIQDRTTKDVCKEIKRKGYGAHNIRFLGMDPHDASKKRSTSSKNDMDIVYEELRVRPQLMRSTGHRATLKYRLDMVEHMLREEKLFFNAKLMPTSQSTPGCINSIRKFATRSKQTDSESYVDIPTHETTEKWKHFIDALHYVLVRYEHGEYRRANMKAGTRRKNKGEARR